jgi:hypothetical protein
MPVEALALPDGNYYLPKSDEIIPADMAVPSCCTYFPTHPIANEFEGSGPVLEGIPNKTRCFFAPMNSS